LSMQNQKWQREKYQRSHDKDKIPAFARQRQNTSVRVTKRKILTANFEALATKSRMLGAETEVIGVEMEVIGVETDVIGVETDVIGAETEVLVAFLRSASAFLPLPSRERVGERGCSAVHRRVSVWVVPQPDVGGKSVADVGLKADLQKILPILGNICCVSPTYDASILRTI
jgi:hypothetical protein